MVRKSMFILKFYKQFAKTKNNVFLHLFKYLIIAGIKLTTVSALITPLSVMAETKTLNFALYGSEQRSSLDEQFGPVLREIEKSMRLSMGEEISIRSHFFLTYEDGVDALIEGKIDFTRIGAASYVKAKKLNKNISIIAVESKKGKKTFTGVIAVNVKSPLKRLEDLKGKTFAFGNKKSTIGRYLSQHALYVHGLHASDFKKIVYLDQHDKVAISVAREVYDAGAFKMGILTNPEISARVKVISTFQAPTQPWVARQGISGKVLGHLRESLLNIKDKKILKNLKREGFLLGDDKDYNDIRKAMELNDLFIKPKIKATAHEEA